MTEEPWFLPAAFGAVVFLQLVLLIAVLRLSSRVSRLFRLISPSAPAVSHELAEQKEATAEQKNLFAEFLAEDPLRKELPKKEQFSEFRRWRDEKGLNWKGPAESI